MYYDTNQTISKTDRKNKPLKVYVNKGNVK